MRDVSILEIQTAGDLRAERGAEAEAQTLPTAEVLVLETSQQPFPDVLDKREESRLKRAPSLGWR